jgi:hypothetical protein
MDETRRPAAEGEVNVAGTMAAPQAGDRRGGPERREGPPAFATVRDEDLEPHEGLRYIARLFKILAVFLILLLIGEVVIGLTQLGAEAIPTLLVEATRLIVFAGLLWGAADMGLMLSESNHDLRATRILVGRLNRRVQRLEEIATDGIPVPARRGPPSAPPTPPPPRA